MTETVVRNRINRLALILLFLFAVFLVGFSTWQLFLGNLEAAFSSLPFLLIVYLFLLRRKI